MWARFAELGWLAIAVPESAGGLGWSSVETAIVAQEFGRGLVTEPFTSCGFLAPSLLAQGAAEAPAPVLAQIASGEALVAVAVEEAGARYDLASAETRVEVRGGSYVLSGRKSMVVGGESADYLIVNARGPDGVTLLLVPGGAAGVQRRRRRLLNGGFAADILFQEVSVAADGLIAAPPQAAALLERAFDQAALLAGAEAVGCMDRILEITAEYLQGRQQFGQPLAKFQVLQHRMADLFVETEMARSALYSGLAALDAPAAQRASAVSAARVRIDRAAHRVGNQGIHLHGGMGMTMEYPVGHLYRRLLMLVRAFGDTEHHLERYEQLSFAGA
jgi:alkylation response protein AidB-like acyl-CoA dehydrogenase